MWVRAARSQLIEKGVKINFRLIVSLDQPPSIQLVFDDLIILH